MGNTVKNKVVKVPGGTVSLVLCSLVQMLKALLADPPVSEAFLSPDPLADVSAKPWQSVYMQQ